MKRMIFLALIFCFSTKISFSQAQLITVQHPTLDTAMFFTNIQQAIDSAWSGSSIYLPAIVGDYSLPGFTVNKKLHIYGVGHYPDSTSATGRLSIMSSITIKKGADSGSISGLYINGNISMDSINNFNLYRNRFGLLILSANTNNLIIHSNVFGAVVGNNAKDCFFTNNIIDGRDNNVYKAVSYDDKRYACIHKLISASFYNNIILQKRGPFTIYNYAYIIVSVTNSLFENNIFATYSASTSFFFDGASYNTFNNNIFNHDNPIPNGSNLGQNNIVIASQDSIFANQAGNVFNYEHNYQLREGNPGINSGTDGTDIGIYGGGEPYKEGAVPIIPHFLKSVITPTTVKDGKLNIEMIIEAQKR